MKYLRTDQGGFTLVEAVIAMLVCTIGLVAMAELMAVTLRLQQLGRNSTSAARLAQDKIDELTTLPFNPAAANYNAAIACGGSLVDDSVATHNDRPMEDNGTPDDLDDDTISKGYTRRWLVGPGPGTGPAMIPDPDLRQVTVRVTPDIADLRTASPYELTTFIRGFGGAVCP